MDYLKLKSGTDIRGIASEGVENEHINLTDEVICTITDAFLAWFCKENDVSSPVELGKYYSDCGAAAKDAGFP